MRSLQKYKKSWSVLACLIAILFFSPANVFADNNCTANPKPADTYCCGGTQNGNTPVETSINLGCKGKGNPIADTAFAIIHFLSDGVGIVIIGSIIYGGIQYSVSRGDPQATAQAVHRIQSTMIALLLFIFGYAIINYMLPAGFLQ